MKRIAIFICLLCPCLLFGQNDPTAPKTCADLNNPKVPIFDAKVTDSTEHSTIGHWVASGAYDWSTPPHTSASITAQCIYSGNGGSQNCDTACSVSVDGATSAGEGGSLNASGSHQVAIGTATGSGSATGGGTSCTGYVGGGVANCLMVLGKCLISVNVTAGGVSVNTNGHSVWSANAPLPLNCAAVSDPQYSPGGAGGGDTGDGGGNGCGGSGFVNDPNAPVDPNCSPIIIDAEGEGFHLTSAANGVMFDISGTGHPIRIGWTAPGSHNAFLALPGTDGLIHSGKDLFGNFTAQDPSQRRNGFLALAEWDEPDQGGNGDGVIDEKDAVFSRLRLWIDDNHDGICQPSELHALSEFGIHALSVNYFYSKKADGFGNQFRYKGRINPGIVRDRRDETPSGEPGRWAYDVFLVTK